jgi:hypothetical protein
VQWVVCSCFNGQTVFFYVQHVQVNIKCARWDQPAFSLSPKKAVGAIHSLLQHRKKIGKTCAVIETQQGRNPDLRLLPSNFLEPGSQVLWNKLSIQTTHSQLLWIIDSTFGPCWTWAWVHQSSITPASLMFEAHLPDQCCGLWDQWNQCHKAKWQNDLKQEVKGSCRYIILIHVDRYIYISHPLLVIHKIHVDIYTN